VNAITPPGPIATTRRPDGPLTRAGRAAVQHTVLFPLLLLALPPSVRRDLAVAAAADRFYRGRLLGSALHLGLGTVPFDRRRHSAESLDACATLIRSGRSLLLFPEGTRSRDGAMARFRTGAARLALATATPVLPVGIRGAHAALPPGARLPRHRQTSIHFGEPIHPRPDEDAAALTARLESAVRVLAGQPACSLRSVA